MYSGTVGTRVTALGLVALLGACRTETPAVVIQSTQSYAPGSVTSIALATHYVHPTPGPRAGQDVVSLSPSPRGGARRQGVSYLSAFVVVSESGEATVLYAADPQSGCLLKWSRDEEASIDPCHGVFTRTGQ
jgi:hypothetical protein